jgi:CheY-like chemotaxis protein
MKKPNKKTVTRRSSRPARVREAGEAMVPTVLHIDDDPNDIELFQAAARKANVRFLVQNVADAEQAMAYLNGTGLYANRGAYPIPDLILLDLKMPKASGFDVLRWIRSHPEAGNLPVVVFSGSELQDDIEQAYEVGADSYLVKPIGFNALVSLVKNIDRNWIAGQLPTTATLAGADRAIAWTRGTPWFDTEGRRTAQP